MIIPVLVCGCPEPLFENCGEEGEIGIVVLQRMDDEVVQDGSEVPAFPPPQGGVFTEFDVSIEGVELEQIVSLEFEIRDGGNVVIAGEFYDLAALPLACQDDGTILSNNTPVGFEFDTVLQELEGVQATLVCTLATNRGSVSETYDVVLRVTGYE